MAFQEEIGCGCRRCSRSMYRDFRIAGQQSSAELLLETMSSEIYMAYSPSPAPTPHSPHIVGLRSASSILVEQEKYLNELLAERQKLNPFTPVLQHCLRLLNQDRTLNLQIMEDDNDSTVASTSPGALKRKRDSSQISERHRFSWMSSSSCMGNPLSAKTPNTLLDIFTLAHEYNEPSSCIKSESLKA